MKSHFSSLHPGLTVVTFAYGIDIICSKQDLFHVNLTLETDFSYVLSPCPLRLRTPAPNIVVNHLPSVRKVATSL
jgi:hypothetical protein